MKELEWRCQSCGKRFSRAGQVHSCGSVPLIRHFRGRPRARELFDAFRAAVEREGGPVRLSVAATRIGLMTRVTFAGVVPRNRSLRAHILLKRKVESPRFVRIDHVPPYWVHFFDLRDEMDLDVQLREWLREAYRIGSGDA